MNRGLNIGVNRPGLLLLVIVGLVLSCAPLWAAEIGAVNRALTRVKVPLGASERPRVLVWLAVSDTTGRALVGSASRADLRQPVMDAGRRHGVPLLLPLLDLEDQSHLDVGEVWGDFGDEVAKASVRYQAGSVVVGRVSAGADGVWQGRWTLYQGTAARRWGSRGTAYAQAVEAGLDGAADILAEGAGTAPAYTPPLEGTWVLMVERIQSAETYAHAVRYLSSLEPVVSVRAQHIDPAAVTFALTLRGAQEDLTRVLAQSKTLVPVSAPGREPRYRWMP